MTGLGQQRQMCSEQGTGAGEPEATVNCEAEAGRGEGGNQKVRARLNRSIRTEQKLLKASHRLLASTALAPAVWQLESYLRDSLGQTSL